MQLQKAERSLRALTKYIAAKAGLKNMDRLSVAHSPDADELQERRSRQFCHVYPRSFKINCTAQIENVSEEVRLGLLLHEIGHIVQQAFDGDKCEVTVDEWVAFHFPEAGYGFSNHRYWYYSEGVEPKDYRHRTAKNIEHVSKKFASLVHGIKV